ncbi:hypothetical protein O0I10_007635 [Lichtheimia ornata]|uniref:Uncharacterized protein n=1 Tax=Lichtheimia ornata TaxID=688661 RepID=A0AAD7XXG7_9FUNG|nr:uncharacterized protein O0I10_007635 [Lichtheimia ornata]KAJ8656558.1 hypothetical protein O0I10_007635 [Lichtheimia ornata]
MLVLKEPFQTEVRKIICDYLNRFKEQANILRMKATDLSNPRIPVTAPKSCAYGWPQYFATYPEDLHDFESTPQPMEQQQQSENRCILRDNKVALSRFID